MTVIHDLTMDLTQPGPTPRIHIKLGDMFVRQVRIALTSGGENWEIPEGVSPVIRFRMQDDETGETFSGVYHTLPHGYSACSFTGNVLTITISSDVMHMPGLVTADVLLFKDHEYLSIPDFEICIHRPPVVFPGIYD